MTERGGFGTNLGKALAGHFLDSDSGKAGRNDTRHAKKYANPVSDWVSLLIAEAKSHTPEERAARLQYLNARLSAREASRKRQAAADSAVADLPLFAEVTP